MIIVNLALRQDDIQKAMEEKGYTFVKKQGLKMYFNALTEDKEQEIKDVKAFIKSTPYGAALFFSVEHD